MYLNHLGVNPVRRGNLAAIPAGGAVVGGTLTFGDLSPNMNNANALPVALNTGEIDIFTNAGTPNTGLPTAEIRGVLYGYYN